MFLKYRCISCHSGDAGAAPGSRGALRQARCRSRDGRRRAWPTTTTSANRSCNPRRKIVAGWENIMPTFQGPGQRGRDHRADCLHSVASRRAKRRRVSRTFRRRQRPPRQSGTAPQAMSSTDHSPNRCRTRRAEAAGTITSTSPMACASWLLTKDHKRIAILYLFTVTVMFFLGRASP